MMTGQFEMDDNDEEEEEEDDDEDEEEVFWLKGYTMIDSSCDILFYFMLVARFRYFRVKLCSHFFSPSNNTFRNAR